MSAQDAPEVKCPYCPMCGAAPAFIAPGLAQCWCPNEACNVFMWSPWDTAAANLADMGEVREVERRPHAQWP
ncbi:hypothetical protein SEA_BERKA_20 [Arthrobacter phage Berka]|nr:hypothetical protein SEA_BERKA_20 [Arthrobacter phage Berka]